MKATHPKLLLGIYTQQPVSSLPSIFTERLAFANLEPVPNKTHSVLSW